MDASQFIPISLRLPSFFLSISSKMGATCSCRTTRTHTIKSVHSACSIVTFHPENSANNLPNDSAMSNLEQFFSQNSSKIPSKLKIYCDYVRSGEYKKVSEIVMRLGNLGEYGVRGVCRLLPFYVHVRRITLWKVGLDLEAVRLISESLVLVTGLEVLGIEGNDMKDECLVGIARSLKLMRGLKELWLSSNQFSMMGALILSNSLKDLPKLAVLNLDFNYLRSEGCKVLCKALIPRGRMKVVSLRANEIDSDAMEELVRLGSSNPPVETLNLEDNFLSQDNCSVLSTLYGSEIVLLSSQTLRT